MGVNLRHCPEHGVDLFVASGAITAADVISAFERADRAANWLVVFSEELDMSGVDIACFPAMRRTMTPDDGEPRGGAPRLSALVNLSERNALFVRFWADYASAAAPHARRRQIFSSVEAGCRWLGLAPAAGATLASAAARMVAAKAETAGAETKLAENRRRIINAASRLFRERGFEAVSVAEIVDAAGVPREAFKGCFETKDDLIVYALIDALSNLPSPEDEDWSDFAAGYLSAPHRDNIATGCAMAALASETVRQSLAAKTAMTVGLNWQIERLSRTAPGEDAAARRRLAIRAWSAMVGAMILARASEDQALGEEILDETRSWITDPSVAALAAAGSPSPEIQPRH